MASFYHEMREFVLNHGAIHNPYLTWFKTGALSDGDLYEFAYEFYNFARFFPKILVAQLVNTQDESVADELTRVLYSELGDGDPKHRHELLYRRFLTSIGLNISEALTLSMLPSTKAYIDGMEDLYSSGSHHQALGASFGLENMAITMWDHLIPGLLIVKQSRIPDLDMTYFTFHRNLESTHEQAMKKAVAAIEGPTVDSHHLTTQERDDFYDGGKKVLDFLEGFWMGLDHKRNTKNPLQGSSLEPRVFMTGATR